MEDLKTEERKSKIMMEELNVENLKLKIESLKSKLELQSLGRS